MTKLRSPRDSTTTSTPAGDPPAAIHTTPLLSGNPPAAPCGGSQGPQGPTSRASGSSPLPGSGGVVELQYSNGASSSRSANETCSNSRKAADLRGKEPAEGPVQAEGRSQLRPGASFMEALVGARTFKPRFDASRRPEEWHDNSSRKRPAQSSVWGRLGPRMGFVHDRLGGRVQEKQQKINGYLRILKTKAVGRCFNCFAKDHRIAVCRDPPRCILCSRSGHKARYCPAYSLRRSAASPVVVGDDSVPAAAAAAAAPSAASSGMAFIPGDSWRRPQRVLAGAARTSDTKEAEQDLQLHGLVAVQLDAHAQLTCELVLRDALQQLRIPSHTLQVTRLSNSAFLLRFQSPTLRNTALSRRALDVGHTTLHLMPWGRQFGAAASLAHYFYRARICFEGVPAHAHQIESVLQLLPKQSFVEAIDYSRHREDEKGCFILWIWCHDPDALHVLGTLQLEELVTRSEEGYTNSESSLLPIWRAEETTLPSYDVIIHLDCVEDYHPLSSSSSGGSFESDVSGQPSDEPMGMWPARHNFVWHLGQPDALPDPPRASVHLRLGIRPVRSLPSGGSAGGGLRQIPPPNQHDMSRFMFDGACRRNNAGGGYQGRHRVGGGHFRWQVRSNTSKVVAADALQFQDVEEGEIQSVEPMGAYCVHGSCVDDLSKFDPMMEEAAVAVSGCCLPMSSQRSVEPTAADRATAQPAGDIEQLVLMMPQISIPDACLERANVTQAPENGNEFTQCDAQASTFDTVIGQFDPAVICASPGSIFPKDADLIHQGQQTSPTSEGPMFGRLFDLNQEYHPMEGVFQPVDNYEHTQGFENNGSNEDRLHSRVILGTTDGRLNKQEKDTHGQKVRQRVTARFTVPLKKSLLCNPVFKPKTPHAKKMTCTDVALSGKGHKTSTASKTLNEKATILLLKASGIIAENEDPSEQAQQQFGNQFVTSLNSETVGDMRNAFGLPENGGADKFSALTCACDDDDA